MNFGAKMKYETNGKAWIVSGCLLAAVAVGFGAIGSHLLKETLDVDGLARWETASKYHMYHALGLIAVGMATTLNAGRRKIVGCVMFVGVLLFSGSLYAYALTEFKPLVAVVPFGGFSMIISWILFAWFSFSSGLVEGKEHDGA